MYTNIIKFVFNLHKTHDLKRYKEILMYIVFMNNNGYDYDVIRVFIYTEYRNIIYGCTHTHYTVI